MHASTTYISVGISGSSLKFSIEFRFGNNFVRDFHAKLSLNKTLDTIISRTGGKHCILGREKRFVNLVKHDQGWARHNN